MDFSQLADIFDGSIFADDYRTDLGAARKRIAALEARTSVDPESDDRNVLLLIQAVYSSICGDFVCADDYLKQLFDRAQESKNTSLLYRCTAYANYIRCIKNNPSFLRFRIDSGSGPAVARGMGASVSFVQLKDNPQSSSFEKSEIKILKLCTGFLTDLWYKAIPAHPQNAMHPKIGQFDDGHDYWNNIRLSGCDISSPAIISYCHKLTLQYRLAGNASNARDFLLGIYEDAVKGGDLITAAHCRLQLGDAILSPPFTSPIALNLVSVVSEIGWSNGAWDKEQPKFALEHDAEAMQSYKEAKFFFEAAGSRRGMGAVFLRYACVNLANITLVHTSKDDAQQQDLVRSAFGQLTKARELFDGDITNSLFIEGYISICKILEGEFFEALKMCFAIGKVARRTGNTCACEFVGTLYLRLAKSLASNEARVQQAAVLCTCAAVCFKGLENPYLELHAVAASAILHQQRGYLPAARRYIENGHKLLDQSIAYIDGIISQFEALRNSYGQPEYGLLEHDLQMLRNRRAACMQEFHRISSVVGLARQQGKDSGSSSTTQLSSMVALLQSIQQFSGVDPSLLADFQSLISIATNNDVMRQKYEAAIQGRRDELVINADIDAAEKYLTAFLQEMEQCPIVSDEMQTMKTTAYQYLGDYVKAKDSINQALPKSFVGGGETLSVPKDNREQLQGVMDTVARQRFDRAVALCFVAKDWDRGMIGIQAMLQKDATSLNDLRRPDDPHDWFNMVWIASILEHNGDLNGALSWYIDAFQVIETYRAQLADTKDRRDTLSTIHSGELFLGMARIAHHFSQSQDGSCGPSEQWLLSPAEWRDQILRFLELGRSRTLLDLLTAQELSPQDFRKWSEYTSELRRKEAPGSRERSHDTESLSSKRNRQDSREEYLSRMYDELVKELESPSLSKLLSKPTAIRESNVKLYASIPESAIVLHISVGRDGLMILCITSQGIIDIYTAETTHLELDRYIFRFAKLFRDRRVGPSSLPAIATCNQHLQAISNELIEPVARHLDAKDHVIFVPSPSLNKIPLSALIYKNEPLFLSKDVSQVPSLAVLQYLVDNDRRASRKVGIIYMDPQSSSEGALDFSTSAAIHIARSFNATPQVASEAFTQSDFVEIYEQSDVLLIATHGTTAVKSAWESSLLLHPPFLVRDLVKLQSSAFLVIFEACVSGLGEESIGNDLLGFSHAVLASGAGAFLGGLWKLSDEASALLMLFLFEELKANSQGKTLARCWRNAQMRLYRLDAAGAVTIFEDLRKRCIKAYKAGLIDRELATRLRWTLQIAVSEIQEFGVDYSHPFYWAPFVLMGHAGLALELG